MTRIIQHLREVPARELAAVFAAEGEEWSRRLYWERGRFVRLLTRLARRAELDGLALVVGGRVAGKVLIGNQDDVFSLEFPYLLPEYRGHGLLSLLIEQGLARIFDGGQASRVEMAFFPLDEDGPRLDARQLGLQTLPRVYMVRQATASRTDAVAQAGGATAGGWSTSAQDLASLLHTAYRGTADALAAEFYRTASGCAAYLEALQSGHECGTFKRSLSGVATADGGGPVGFLLGTELAAGTGHIAQIAIRPEWRRRGLADALLHRFHQQAAVSGLRRTTLLVTEANETAINWYRRRGYAALEPFHSYWWEPASSPAR